MADIWIQNVNTDERPSGDIVIVDGRIQSIGSGPASWSGEVLDGAGLLALPGLVDGHAHLDKTLWGLPWRPHSATPGLPGLIANERSSRKELPPVVERAGILLDAYIDQGTTLIRSHVDVDPDNGLSAVEGVLEAAADREAAIDVQVVAFPQSGMVVEPGTAALMESAISAGAHLVGGLDPAGFDGDPVRHLDEIFGIAERQQCGVDLHLHDRGTLGRWELGLVIERTRALGMAGQVTVSHAFCLCDDDPSIPALIEQLGEAGIGLATVAPGSVGPLPLDLLAQHGVPVCLGQDGIRDLWSPWGDADMLSRAGQLAWRSGYRHDADIKRCVDMATSDGAAAIGVADHGLKPGARGDVVLVDAAGAAEAAVACPPRSVVIKSGVVMKNELAAGPSA